MAVSVNFGTTDRDMRWIDKAPTWAHQNVSCDIYGSVDRLNPILKVDTGNVDISGCNYMEIPEFGRFYLIQSITAGAAKVLYVSGHVDVLQTYKDQILQCHCIAERNTSSYNFYLPDGRRLFNSYPFNEYRTIGNDLGAPDRPVLITIGLAED